MTVVVEVEAPRVARALGEDLEDVLRRMKAPDRAVEPLALGVWGAGLADVRVREDAVRAVQPAVGSPRERVEHLVRVLIAPAVEQDLRRTRRQIRPRLDRNEHQIRRGADPHAAEADFDAADEVQVLDEHLAAVEAPVAVGVLEDQDAIPALSLGRAQRIGVRLGHPEAPAIVEREANRPNDVGLRGGKLDREPLGHGHRLRGFRRRETGVPDRVHRRQRVDLRRGDLGGEERSACRGSGSDRS